MQFLKKITFRQKLLLAVLFPLGIACWFSIDNILTEVRDKTKLEEVSRKTTEIKLISQLIHEFQKERDYSVLYINNATYDMQVKLREQVKQSDSLIRKAKISAVNQQMDTAFFAEMTSIQKIRGAVEHFSLTYQEADEYFSEAIEKLMDRVASTAISARTEKTGDAVRAYISLVNTKESLGRMRTTVNKAFDMQIFDGLDYGKFAAQKGAFEHDLKSFLKLASPALSDNFSRDFNQGSVARMLEMTSYAFNHPNDKLYMYTADEWWFSTTNAINIIHSVEGLSISEIEKTVTEDISSANEEIEYSIALVAGAVLIVIIMVTFSVRSVNNQMRRLNIAAKKIQEGNTDIDLAVHTKDSIGNLTQSFLSLAENSKELSDIANKIGQGNYNVPVNIRGPHDVLGTAILNMQQSLKNTTSELNQLVVELKQSNQYKSEFLANMSHELRTPLNSMLILSKLLMDNREGNLSADQVDSAAVIHKSGNALLRLINDILDLSKIEAGKLDVEFEEFRLNDLLKDVEDIFKPLATEKKVALFFENKSDQKTIVSDSHRLEQIMKNIVSNAIKFTPAGGQVSVIASVQNSKVVFKVKDSGIGIPKNKQGHIFEAFKQADGSINRQYGGTGLGLSITKNLVDLLGGEISFESNEGQGTEFSVALPLELHQVTSVSLKPDEEGKKDEEWLIEEKNTLVKYSKMLRGKSIHFYSKNIMHVYRLSSLLEKYNCTLIDMSDEIEFKEKFISDKYFILLSEEENVKDLIDSNVTKVLVLNADVKYTEAILLEQIKNTIEHV